MKYKRLPNGFGNINYLGKGRRRPYRVRVGAGWSDDGKALYSNIGYFESYEEALMALSDYHRNPAVQKVFTFGEVFERWSADRYPQAAKNTIIAYETGRKVCAPFWDRPIMSVDLFTMENVARASGKSENILSKYKIVLSLVFKWAVAHEIIPPEHNRVEFLQFAYAGSDKKVKKPFTRAEISRLWEASADPWAQVVLMLIYSGARVSELLALKKSDVHLSDQFFFVSAAKTSAGVRRVPIHDRTLPFFAARMSTPGPYLFGVPSDPGRVMKYINFYSCYFVPLMDRLEMSHSPHETRHTCISLLNSAGVPQTTIKFIVGHSSAMSLTEKVYTHVTVQELVEAINRISV